MAVSTTTTTTVHSIASKHKVSSLIVVGTLVAVLGLTATICTVNTALAFTASRRHRQQYRASSRRIQQQFASVNGSEGLQEEKNEETAFEAAESMVQIELSNEKTKDLLMMGDLMPEDDFSQVVPSIPEGADADGFELAPANAMTFQKYVTMNTKRVPVQIRYTANSGLRPYFLTVARKLKTDYPDVLIERALLSKSDSGGGGTSGGSSGGSTDSESGLFEVVIDGRAVVRLNAGRRGVTGTDGGMTIFVSMEEVDQAIGRARRRRRPSTVYGEENEKNVRLEVLKDKAAESMNSKQ